MIVHSTRNNLDDTCEVRVEAIDGARESEILAFAMGAAGKHNAGFDIFHPRVIRYYDDTPGDMPVGDDTSTAWGAVVLCRIDPA